ncbi:MAG: PD40 domain-containing protein, partial [Gemmatimonadales bacterium]|nr:PD40 domain-containing protein [Gemmatimonadales bacterium]
MKRQLVLAVLLLVTRSATGQTQALTPLSLDALLTSREIVNEISGPSFAPGGQLFTYTALDRRPERIAVGRNTTPGGWYVLGGDIWLAPSRAGATHRNLTQGKGNNWGPSWSPDGRRVAFYSDRAQGPDSGIVHLWLWEQATGITRQVGSVRVLVTSLTLLDRPSWTADGRSVLVSLRPEIPHNEPGQAEARIQVDRGVTATVYSFDPANPDSSTSKTSPSNLNPWQRSAMRDLALVDVQTGVVRRLTRGLHVYSQALSPSRRVVMWVAVTGIARPGTNQLRTDLMVTELATGTTRRLVSDVPLLYAPHAALVSWSPNSDALAYRVEGPEIKDEVYVVSVAGGPPRRIADD